MRIRKFGTICAMFVLCLSFSSVVASAEEAGLSQADAESVENIDDQKNEEFSAFDDDINYIDEDN